MKYLKRLTEPSSMAGLAVLLSVFGVPNAPEAVQGVGHLVTGAAGLLAVFMPEKK